MNHQNMSKIKLREMYEITAKLLAVENIKVVFNASLRAPATFDVKSRVLKIKTLADNQMHLIPGLVVHEVGHAIFTNPTAKDLARGKSITQLFNIVEDGYQERKMCKLYPGSRKYLAEVFNEFFNPDDIKKSSSSNKIVNIVNVLNYNAKGCKFGKFLQYPSYVSQQDIEVLREAENLDMFKFLDREDFVEKLAAVLDKYGELDEDPSEGEGEGGAEGTEGGEGSTEGGDGDNSEGNNSGEGDSASIGKATEKALSNGLVNGTLLDHHDKFEHLAGGKNTYEISSPEVIRKASSNYDILFDTKGANRLNKYRADNPRANLSLESEFKDLKTKSRMTAQNIYSQFIVRKTSSNLAQAQYRKSGCIDPSRLALHSLTDDIFLNTEIVPNETNHAYMVVLDWSASMNGSLSQLLHRIMELTYFARLAEVELEVMLYTTDWHGNPANRKDPAFEGYAWSESIMTHVLNTSKASDIEIDNRLKSMLYAISSSGSSRCGSYSDISTGGTNILEGVILGHDILSKMNAENKTLFVLSDGDDSRKFDYVMDIGGGKAEHPQSDTGLTFHGYDICSISDKKHINGRSESTKIISDFYKSIGHHTISISWDCSQEVSDGNSYKFGTDNINVNTPKNIDRNAYVNMDNVFISKIVKGLL